MNRDVQHAEITVRVAIPLEKEFENNDRIRIIEEGIETILTGCDKLEFRTIVGDTKLLHTETEMEAAERYMAEKEAKALKKQQEILERHWDNNGHF